MTKIITTTYETSTISGDNDVGGITPSTVGSNVLQIETPVQTSWLKVNTDGTVELMTPAQVKDSLGVGSVATREVVTSFSDTGSVKIPDVNWINNNVFKSSIVGYGWFNDNTEETVVLTGPVVAEGVINSGGVTSGFTAVGSSLVYTEDNTTRAFVTITAKCEANIYVGVNGEEILSSKSSLPITQASVVLSSGDELSIMVDETTTVTEASVVVRPF